MATKATNTIKAVNNFIFVIRDKEKAEQSGLIIPKAGREKPHQGTIYSVGSLVRDREIKAGKGKKALFHKGVGQELPYEGQVYLVLNELEVMAVI